MRKWNRNRRRPKASAEERPPETSTQAEAPAGEAETSEPPAQAAAGRSKSRARGRRSRKKPAAAAPLQPLIPAYSETEGPRAPAVVSVAPGAPTGEAGELGEVVTEAPPAPAAAAPAPAVPAITQRATRGAVVLSVGLPGSGKTTWFKRKGVTPLSSDVLRSLLFDDPTEQRHQDLVFSSLRYLLRTRMMAHMPMNYVDATNLSPKERRHWVRLAREFGYEVHAVYFDVSLETCLERNRRRQRVVPQDVMQRMAAKLRPPTFEEGFSKIVVVRVKHRLEAEPVEAATAEEAATEESPEAPGPEQE